MAVDGWLISIQRKSAGTGVDLFSGALAIVLARLLAWKYTGVHCSGAVIASPSAT